MTQPIELTVAEAASRLGVTGSLVRRWIRDGKLPARRERDGYPWMIRLSDLAALERQRKEKP